MRSTNYGLRTAPCRPTAGIRLRNQLRPANPQSRSRFGYTLIELTLVLAILGALAAVAWPSVLRMQADHELSAAAEQVRKQIGQARTKAIHAGLAFQFRFEPHGRRYCVIPFEAEPETESSASMGETTNKSTPLSEQRFAGEISQRITFRAASPGAADMPVGQKIPEAAFQGLPHASELTAVNWSGPLILAADGTAADATVTLGDSRGHRVDITIRGLTGAAAVGPMRREAVR